MSHHQFIRMPAERSSGGKYEVVINHHFINFVLPSREGQVGKSLITMARAGDGNRNTVASMHDLDTLGRQFSALTPVQVYSTVIGKVGSRGLVNLSRVVQITDYEKFFVLAFADGEELSIADKLV